MSEAARLQVLIVDDEPLARLRLRSLLQDLPGMATQVVGEAGDAETALALLNEVPADVVLLDIRMPGQGGLRMAAALRAMAAPPAVVFVSAHAEHALKAFELEALDYLTKPVRRERLLAALQRVPQRTPEAAAPAPAAAAPVLVISERGRVLRLPLHEVLYARAEQKYVTLRTAQHSHVLDETLAELEPRLGAGFVRIHRNALVARSAMRALELQASEDGSGEGWAVRVAPLDEWLAVSRRQVGALRAALAQES
jgi:two-component system response regulator AlgR